MTETQARNQLTELVRLRSDIERYQRAMSALAMIEEIRSSASDQLGRLAFDTHRKYIELESRLIAQLCSAPDSMSSIGDYDPLATVTQIPNLTPAD